MAQLLLLCLATLCCLNIEAAGRMLLQEASLQNRNVTRSVGNSRDLLEALNDPAVSRVLLNGAQTRMPLQSRHITTQRQSRWRRATWMRWVVSASATGAPSP